MKTSTLLLFCSCLVLALSCSKKVIPVDITAPSMQLIGDDSLYVLKGEMGKDPGVKAFDNFDGDVGLSVISNWDSIAKLNKVGKNLVTYRVSDKANNLATTTRIVYIDFTAKMPLGVYNTAISHNYTSCTTQIKSNGTSTISATDLKDHFKLQLRDTLWGGVYVDFDLEPISNDLSSFQVSNRSKGNLNRYGGSAYIDPSTAELRVFYYAESRASSINCTWTYSLVVQQFK